MLRARHGSDNGFTLVELTMSIALLGIVMGGVCAAMFVAMRTSRDADVTLSEARDVRLAASYLSDDVAGAQTMASSGTAQCGGEALTLELRGSSFDQSASPSTVLTASAYVLRSAFVDGQPSLELHRLSCQAATVAAFSPLKDETIARLISTTVAPDVTCTTRAGATAACSATDATGVTLQLASRSGAIIRLTGTRRTT
jgi:prepilin-type N-terminal cleavage/methylation domain-containing protein